MESNAYDLPSRRTALLLGVAAVAAGCGQPSETSEKTEASADCTFNPLNVQTAPSIGFKDGTLTLKSVHCKTVYFSDRPERVAGWMPTEEILDHWVDGGEDSFKAVPPNADVSMFDGKEFHECVVVLSNPRLEEGDLLYDVKTLAGELPAKGGPTTMFIDAGHRRRRNRRVARRTARRTSRRVARRQD